MLDCIGPQACHESVPNTTTSCGSDFAYIFFPSFFFVSSILVNTACNSTRRWQALGEGEFQVQLDI